VTHADIDGLAAYVCHCDWYLLRVLATCSVYSGRPTLESSDLGVVCFWGIVLESGNMAVKRYLFVWAQNATPVHKGFLAALKNYPAKLVAIAGRYHNPTSRWSVKDESQEWWTPEIEPYLTEKRKQLCPNLTLLGDISVQPTAHRPLTGFEGFVGKSSGIVGHPKRALKTVPSGTRVPRILATTGAVTVPNYTKSRAGKRGEHNHVLGALVCEIDEKGLYWLRQVTADRSGAFYDLDKRYTPTGVEKAPRALSLALGDLHAGADDLAVLGATKRLINLVKPQHVVLHDTLDFSSASHHAKGLKASVDRVGQKGCVRTEVADTAAALTEIAEWGDHTVHVVRSNHDAHLDQWADSTDPRTDPRNVRYWCELQVAAFQHHEETGKWPMLFPMECERLGVPKTVKFLGLNDSLKLADVEMARHGHVGIGGSRGSPAQYAKLGVKTTTGHTHAPEIVDGSYVSGVTGSVDMGYNSLPSAWAQASTLQYADGKRAIIFFWAGKFRAKVRR
jgi:hypothetical protein